MGLNFDPQCGKAIDLAKRAVPEGREVDILTLACALYHATDIKKRVQDLTRYLKQPKIIRKYPPDRLPLEESLSMILTELENQGTQINAVDLFVNILSSEAGRRALVAQGMPETVIENVAGELQVREREWRSSDERKQAIKALSPFGRILTQTEPPHSGMIEKETAVKELIVTLMQRKKRNALIVGLPGTGKSALVYELASRIVSGDASLPSRLLDTDIFELIPSYLRAGASVVGQYDDRVKAIIEVLTANPKIILFVDEIHSLFQSGTHSTGPFSDANESFKGPLAKGEITCIGCTTSAEYRQFIQSGSALERRFSIITLDPPSPETTARILKARIPKVEEYYSPLRIPEDLIKRVVELTEEYLPNRYQPDKSIQLLDKACARSIVDNSAAPELTEEYLEQALEETIGHRLVREDVLTESKVYEDLRSKIVGQDEALKKIARTFVAGLGSWRRTSTPRAVFLFGGPTGVGKTETALLLSKILGDGEEKLIRIDCNTLQGTGHDSGPARSQLLGSPPGYIGYVRGQGGLLSKIRDMPESVVLFDEFEKSHPGVGELLLQIIDNGNIEDVDGNRLDFRRSYIIFTTNAGCIYDLHQLGFQAENVSSPQSPQADPEAMKRELRARGLGEEFLGRIKHVIIFKGLDKNSIHEIVEHQLNALKQTAEIKGFRLQWTPQIVFHLASQWQSRFGVRHLTTILRNRITEQLGLADAEGELEGVESIRLELMSQEEKSLDVVGLATRSQENETLVIKLA